MRRKWVNALGFLATVLLVASPLWADPPARIGRLNLIDGNVSFHPPTVDEWAAAQLNYPLTTGDHLWVDNNSRAEVHVGSTQIQLAPQTDFQFLNLNDQIAQIRIGQGTMELRVRFMAGRDTYEIDTPNVAISLLRPGWCRFDVDSQGNTTVTNRDGAEVEVTAAGSSFNLYPNQSAVITGWDSPTYDVYPAPRLDSFDQWCMERGRREDRLASVRYVPREMVGCEDLDYFGIWRDLPDYGWCWRPNWVSADWAPYRYGHWCWEHTYGWTWIDDNPWGFAPFHYGRWVYASGGWFWTPGPPIARPYYAPALVAFVGGRNWSVSFGTGGAGIGWFPLGPREPYIPPYYASPGYLRAVNYNIRNIDVTNIQITRVHYANFRAPGAVTVVPERAFVRSDPVNRNIKTVERRALESAAVIGMAPAVAPRPESVVARPGFFGRTAAAPPRAIAGRPVVVRTAPPPPAVPFSVQQRVLEQRSGRPLDPQSLNKLQPRGPASRHPLVRPAVTPAASAAGLRPARPNLPRPHAVAGTGRPVQGAQPMEGRPISPGQAPGSQSPELRRAAPGPGNQRSVGPSRQAPVPGQQPEIRRGPPGPESRGSVAAPGNNAPPPATREMRRGAPAPEVRRPAGPPPGRNMTPRHEAPAPEMRRPAPAPEVRRPAGPPPGRNMTPRHEAPAPEMRRPAPAPEVRRPAGPPPGRNMTPRHEAPAPEMRRPAPAPEVRRPAGPPPGRNMTPRHEAPAPEMRRPAPATPNPAGAPPPQGKEKPKREKGH